MKIEPEPDPEPLERETKLKRTFRVQEGDDSDEETINIFREINNIDMTIEPGELEKIVSYFLVG